MSEITQVIALSACVSAFVFTPRACGVPMIQRKTVRPPYSMPSAKSSAAHDDNARATNIVRVGLNYQIPLI